MKIIELDDLLKATADIRNTLYKSLNRQKKNILQCG